MGFVKPTAAPHVTLVHISDFHICRPASASLGAFVNKRALSVMSWTLRRRREHDGQVFAALVDAVRRVASDQIVVTGDLTQLSLPAEFERAGGELSRLGAAGEVFVVPGNHDALVRTARLVPSALSGFLASDQACGPASPAFPSLRVRGRVALIGVSTAQPTNALSAAGRIGHDQLERLGDRLAACGRAGWFRVLLIHHPPLPDGVAPRKRLRDATGLHDVIARHGAELILHGHTHRRSSGALPGPSGPVPVFGISSATAVHRDPLHRAAFAIIRIAHSNGGWSAARQEHVYDPVGGRFLAEPGQPIY